MPRAIPSHPAGRQDKRQFLDQAGVLRLLCEPLPAKGKTRTVFDSELPSYAVRISPKGLATFCLVYSVGGKIQRYTIGRFRMGEGAKLAKGDPGRGLTARDARRKAVQLRAQIENREKAHPAREARERRLAIRREQEERRQRERDEADLARFTLQGLMDAYVLYLKKDRKASAPNVASMFKRTITVPFPDLATMPATRVTVTAIMPVFHRLIREGKPREAEKLCASLKAAYSAACRATHDASMHSFEGFKLQSNPLSALKVSRPKVSAEEAAAEAKVRKWALTEEQLAHYWRRISEVEGAHGALMRFHLMTGGQRAQQLSRLQVIHHDPQAKTVTLYDTKGRRTEAYEHVVPLLPEAEKAMAEMRQVTQDKDGNDIQPGPYLFTVSNGRQAAVYHTLRDDIGEISAAMVEAEEVERPFTAGIIRKTVETRLAALGVSKEVRARLQSHGIGGIQDKHYDAHDYDKEKRAALRKLRQLCEGKKDGKVVPLRRKAS